MNACAFPRGLNSRKVSQARTSRLTPGDGTLEEPLFMQFAIPLSRGGRAAVPAGVSRHSPGDSERSDWPRRAAAIDARSGRATRDFADRSAAGVRAPAGGGIHRGARRVRDLRFAADGAQCGTRPAQAGAAAIIAVRQRGERSRSRRWIHRCRGPWRRATTSSTAAAIWRRFHSQCGGDCCCGRRGRGRRGSSITDRRWAMRSCGRRSVRICGERGRWCAIPTR